MSNQHLVLFLLLAASLAAAPVDVNVTLLHDDRFAALSDADRAGTLDVARTMIRKAYARDVVFTLVAERPLKEFAAEHRARNAPFAPDPKLHFHLFDGRLADFRQAIFENARRYGTVEQIQRLFPPDARRLANHVEAANALADRYASRIDELKRLRIGDDPLITRDTLPAMSLAWLENWMLTRPRKPDLDLYLSNGLLIDDALAGAAPHTLVSGLLNGVSYPLVNTALVAYQPLITNVPALSRHGAAELRPEQRHVLIAYVIAHEVGAHLLANHADLYDPAAGPACPLAAHASPAWILSYETWAKPTREPRQLDLDLMRYSMCRERLRVAIAQRDAGPAIQALEDAQRLPRDLYEDLEALFLAAKW